MLAGILLADFRGRQATLSPAHQAMGPEHLLHSKITDTDYHMLSAKTLLLPFVPAAENLMACFVP